MTVIRPNSISGINSITSNGGDISIFRADGSVSDLTINNITSGVVTATTFSGNLSGGTINATSGTVTGNLGVGGVLTYEDVTNIDSVGIITARTDVLVGSTIKLGASSGIITATSFRGDASQMTGAGLGTDGSANTSGIITASHFVPTSQGALSHRNLIINGDMRVAERGSSEVTVSHDTNTFRCDRFGFTERTGGSVGLSQSSTAPVGFDKSLYVRLLSTDTSLTGNEYSNIRYVVEDLDVKHLEWGTANAKSLTLTFYTYSNVAGQTFCLNVTNWPTNQRSFIAEYTRPSGTANTWLKHVINIPGDTTGTWTHITLQWVLAASADYTRSGTGWAAWSGSGGLEMATSNQYNWFSDSNHFYLAGVQLEMGDTSTPFEYRSQNEQLARCQRYFYAHKGPLWGEVSAGDHLDIALYFPVPMRTSPSFSQVDSSIEYKNRLNQGNKTSSNIYTVSGGTNAYGAMWIARPSSGSWDTQDGRHHYWHPPTGNTSYSWSAEL